MRIGTVKASPETGALEVYLDLGPAIGAAVYWIFWHGMFVLLGILLYRAYLSWTGL
jgi:hypothetical protein